MPHLPLLDQAEGRVAVAQALGFSQSSTGPTQTSYDDVVFVSVDCEWGGYFKPEHLLFHKLTEIGLATLDTRDIRGIAPGTNASTWIAKVGSKHYRTRDTIDIKSKTVDIRGARLWAPDRFEFGNSTFIDRDQLAEAFSKDLLVADTAAPGSYRKVVLVSHGWDNESKWLTEAIGLDIDSLPSIVAVIDSQTVLGNAQNTKPGLDQLMRDYGMIPLNLHNGANDAVYTLGVLMVGTAFRNAHNAAREGLWELTNMMFPQMQVRGDEGIQLMKQEIAKELGDRCERCCRYGHVEQDFHGDEKQSGVLLPVSKPAEVMKPGEYWIKALERLQSHSDDQVIIKLRRTSGSLMEQDQQGATVAATDV